MKHRLDHYDTVAEPNIHLQILRGIFRHSKDVLIWALCIKTLIINGLNHALDVKLVHISLVCSISSQLCLTGSKVIASQ